MLENKTQYLSNLFNIELSLLKEVSSEIEWDEECYLIDKWSFMDEVYKSKMFRIDNFPKTISIEGRYHQLELFFDEENKDPLFFEKEKNFLMVLSKLWAYSSTYVESNIRFKDDDFLQEILDEEQYKLAKQIFSKEDIILCDDWETLKFLLTLSLRDYISTCIYLADLKIIIWVKGLCSVVYLCNKNHEDFVRTICTTEGLYLYSIDE